jgi:hypothetical protein
VRLEGLGQLKNPMTSLGIEPGMYISNNTDLAVEFSMERNTEEENEVISFREEEIF